MGSKKAERSYGNAGFILRVDLSTNSVSKEPIGEDVFKKYIGGRGLAAYCLFKENPKGIDPLSADNRLIFAAGPLTGSNIPYSSRMAVVTKSPLTSGYTRAMTGGHFPAIMKHSGIDGIVIQGKAQRPVYLNIEADKAELLDAGDLWGRGVQETTAILRAKHGKKSRLALIGQAGENRVPYACVMIDWKSAAGRGGAGAVMGSKNLKGIVVNSNARYSAADPEGLKTFVKWCRNIVKTTDAIQAFSDVGTPGLTTAVNNLGVLPTRNYQTGSFEGISAISIDALKKYHAGKAACYACPVACKKKHIVEEGDYKTEVYGPEYETIGLLGSNCGNADMASIIHANFLCNDYALDTMSAGNVIAYAMECYEKGILTKKDTEGIELKFGNHAAIIELIHKISRKKGFGRKLAQGVKRFSEEIGATEFAAHVKGLEMPSYDPRGLQGFGLAFAVGNRGACHNLTSMLKAEFAGEETNRFETKGKGSVLRTWALNYVIYDSACLCSFSRGFMTRECIAQALSYCSGLDLDEHDLALSAERVYTLEKMFNLREGIGKEEDRLPERFLKEPMPEGPAKGRVNNLHEMLEDCYTAMGWDQQGVPKQELLQRLGLSD